jgi:hypothetical protein
MIDKRWGNTERGTITATTEGEGEAHHRRRRESQPPRGSEASAPSASG